MEKKINMPKLGPDMESGILCAWLKEEGEPVTAGEPLFEIETNKVVNQIEATESGVLKQQFSLTGAFLSVGIIGALGCLWTLIIVPGKEKQNV